MQIVNRSGWGARVPKKPPARVSASRRRFFVVHHSGAPATQTVRAIQDWCMNGRGFNDIDYNFLVRATTGEVYEGRGWSVVGSHTVGYNTTGIGVCVIGDDEIGDAAKRSVRWLYDQANHRSGRTLEIRGHRQLATTGTDCPGDVIAAWLRAGMPGPAEERPTPRTPIKPQEEPMDTWTDPTIPLTEMTAERLGLKEGDKRAAGLLLQNTVIASIDANRKLDKVVAQLQVISTQNLRLAEAVTSRDPKAIAAAVPVDLIDKVAGELAARRKS